jgi:hypothetical protein
LVKYATWSDSLYFICPTVFSLADILIVCLFSEALLMSTSSLKLRMFVRFEHDTVLYPMSCLDWHCTSQYEIYALFVHSLPVLPWLLKPPCSCQYRSRFLWKIIIPVKYNFLLGNFEGSDILKPSLHLSWTRSGKIIVTNPFPYMYSRDSTCESTYSDFKFCAVSPCRCLHDV